MSSVHNRLFPGAGSDFPWAVPPAGFETIDRNAAGTVPFGTRTVLTSIILPGSQYEGWIVEGGIYSQNFASLYFQIQVDGQPLRDYENIRVPLGQPDLMQRLLLPLLPNKVTRLIAINSAGGGAPLGYRFRLYGWYYPVGGKK
jgi:hypothetical protein